MFTKPYFPTGYFPGGYFPPMAGEWSGPSTNLGRYRVGETIVISVAGGADYAPVGRFVPSVSGQGPILFSPTRAGRFEARLRVAGLPSLGTFVVEVSRVTGGVASSDHYRFTAVGGGDSGGRVVSLVAVDRPGGSRVLAHLDSGLLVQGNSPRI